MADFDTAEERLTVTWRWESQSRNYANYGNANQWTVNAGLASLASESAQNSNDARLVDLALILCTRSLFSPGKTASVSKIQSDGGSN